MNLKRAKYLVVLLIGFACQHVYSQDYTPIDGVINKYTSITAILSDDDNNVDSVVVSNSSEFLVNDTVMIYCVKGATIGTSHDSTYLPGDNNYLPGEEAQAPGNTGRYAILRITEKIGNILVFNVTLNPEILPMGAGEVAQLIKVRSFRYANVTSSGLQADPWDPATGTGGVVALFVHGVLRLDGDIDVSGDGLKGAPGSTDALYPYACSSDDTLNFYEPFYLDGNLRAGLKGEGITDTRFPYNRGKASNINGGGGGNGLHAGGGGGSNYSAGVRGGDESYACDPGVSITGGQGGFDLGRNGWYYLNNNAQRSNRIFFGGGGGSGTQTVSSSSTDGGNGGGIVVIVADTIDGNGHYIRADGGDVSETAVDAAGAGGGGGGCIILEVAGYKSNLRLSAVGGDGGNSSSTGSDTTGMGGAGGGGIYWLSETSDPPEVLSDFSTGMNGVFESSPDYDYLDSPNPPFEQYNLEAPLRGFVFNPVPSEFTYCSDVDPDPIVTSDPRGGDGTYTYMWRDSSRQHDWADAPGVNNLRDYDPPILSDTTYYRRIVTSAGLADTSFRIAVYVHEAIAGNTIAAEDTVCYGLAPELFESTATISGGYPGVTYNYKWQQMPDGSGSYTDITGTTTEPTYQAGGLDISTDYRRIAYAGVCVSTSNEETVTVLPTLTGNDITPNDTICINTIPDLISGPVPSDGDQGDIRYQWLSSTAPGDMGTLISGETAIDYQSPALSQTTYIRRVVLSGRDDACKDTSAYVEILNVPDITGNIISSDQTLCQEDQAGLLNESTPAGGGYLGLYDYTWISSTDQSNWAPAGGNDDVRTDFDPGIMSGDTTWYRRVVGSGGLELVCKDTSNLIVINVLPSITNNVLTPADDLKCQLDMPELISGSLPGGGATVAGSDPTQAFRWEVAQTEGDPGSGDWTHPSSGAIAQDYMDPDQLLTDMDRWYQRIVFSGPGGECIDTSNLVHLVVHSEITANDIDATEAICFNTSRPLRNMAMTGGESGITPVYTWRQWLEGQSSADAVDIPGSDDIQYTSGPYTDPGTLIYNYDRVVEIGACRDTSNEMLVTIMQLPGGVLTGGDFDPLCEQDTVLVVDLNMDALSFEHYTTPWEVILTDGINPGIDTGFVDQDVATIDISLDTYGADHVSYTYEIESIRYYPEADDYYCISSAAELPLSPVGIDVSRRPDPYILVDGEAMDSFKVCSTTALLEMNPDNGTLSQWSEPAGSVFFSPGGGTNEYNVSIPDNPADYGEFRIYIRSEAGDCAGQDYIDLHFFEQPAPANARPDTTLWLASSVELSADPPTAGIGTWTVVMGNGKIEEENNPNTLVTGLDFGEENEFRWTISNGEYPGICTTSDYVTIVRRYEAKKYSGFSPNGDMSNEYFIMQGLPYADEFSISFFNSLGSTVRTITNENVDELEVDPSLIAGGLREDEIVVWDGRASNGNMVPSGTYYFVVTYTTHELDGPSNFNDTGYVVVESE